MRVKEISNDEIVLFYLWLSGSVVGAKQLDNLLPVYVCCPAERPCLLREFLQEFHNESRFNVLWSYLNNPKSSNRMGVI